MEKIEKQTNPKLMNLFEGKLTIIHCYCINTCFTILKS